jgi:hypothetical protein
VTAVTVQFGNSDDRLTQREWSELVAAVSRAVNAEVLDHGGGLHFFGTAPADAPWQNACWVIELPPADDDALLDGHYGARHLVAQALKRELAAVTHAFRQDSFSWQLGDVELVPPGTFVPRAPATPVPDEFIIADDDVPRRFKT